MTLAACIVVTQWFFLWYFICVNLGYIVLNLLSLASTSFHQ